MGSRILGAITMVALRHVAGHPGHRGAGGDRWWGLLVFSTALVALAADSAPDRKAPDDPSDRTPPGAHAQVRVRTAGELRQAVLAARPGARILVEPGNYEGGLHFEKVHGAPGEPIVIAGADPRNPPVIQGKDVCLQLSDPRHLELRDMILQGGRSNGLNIDDAGSFETPALAVILRNLVVRDVGSDGNQDGIKLSGVDDFRISSCTVERWGRNGSAIDMVGCHRGFIENCTVSDRESNSAATGIQAKGGSAAIVIRRCRFEHAGQRAINVGGSTGLAYFRPQPEGYEARDVTVEGSTFIGSEAPVAFVGVDGAVVRFNTFYRPRRWFLRILQETRRPEFVPCRKGSFEDNIVVFRSGEVAAPVNVGPGTAPETFAFARNFWFCIDDPSRSRPGLPVKEVDGAGGVDPLLCDPEKGDLSLKPGSQAGAFGAGAFRAEDGREPRSGP